MNTLKAAYDNIRDFYRRIFWEWRDSTTEHQDGVVLNYSGLRWLSGANQIWVDNPDRITPRLLSEAVSFFRPFFAEWSLIVIDTHQPGLLERCLDYGCFVRWDSPVMLLAQPPIISETGQQGNRIEQAYGEMARSIMRNIVAESFHMDAVVNYRLMRPEHDYDATIQHYLAYRDGHPAAAATLTYTPQMAGIWNVGTRRMFRRRGLAGALMARMLLDAVEAGYTQSTLIASNMGYPLYARMGYQTIATIYYLGYSSY